MTDTPTCPTCGSDDPMCGCCPEAEMYASTPTDDELPGMWESADFTGGDPDERSYAERERTTPTDEVREALEARDRILLDIRGRMPRGEACASLDRLGLRYEGDLLLIIATIEAALTEAREQNAALRAVAEADGEFLRWLHEDLENGTAVIQRVSTHTMLLKAQAIRAEAREVGTL